MYWQKVCMKAYFLLKTKVDDEDKTTRILIVDILKTAKNL